MQFSLDKMTKKGIGCVGYAPDSRPPDPPPLSVTPLILSLQAPIRHIFEEMLGEIRQIWTPGCLYSRNDKGGVREKRVGRWVRRSGRQRNKNDQPRCWRKYMNGKCGHENLLGKPANKVTALLDATGRRYW